MKRIEKLTAEQEAQIPIYIQKWVDKASEPINRETAVNVVKELFGKDKTVLIAESIQNAIDIVKYISGDQKIEYSSQLRSQLNSQLNSQIDSQLRSQLNSQLNSQIDSQLNSQLRSQLNNQLRSQLYSQLNNQLRSQLYSQKIYCSYYTTLWWYSLYGYYDFAKSIGVNFDEKIFERMGEIILNVPFIITLGNILIVIEKPESRWSNGRLHSTNNPAIRWKDGTGIYLLNSVRFEKELFKTITSENVSAKDILSIEDIDQRTQAMRFLPADEMVKELKGELLDEYNKFDIEANPVNYKLYKFPKGEVFTEDAYYCLFDCPSTRKKHMEGVEVSKTVAEAMSWAEEITEENWKMRIPLLHEV